MLLLFLGSFELRNHRPAIAEPDATNVERVSQLARKSETKCVGFFAPFYVARARPMLLAIDVQPDRGGERDGTGNAEAIGDPQLRARG